MQQMQFSNVFHTHGPDDLTVKSVKHFYIKHHTCPVERWLTPVGHNWPRAIASGWVATNVNLSIDAQMLQSCMTP